MTGRPARIRSTLINRCRRAGRVSITRFLSSQPAFSLAVPTLQSEPRLRNRAAMVSNVPPMLNWQSTDECGIAGRLKHAAVGESQLCPRPSPRASDRAKSRWRRSAGDMRPLSRCAINLLRAVEFLLAGDASLTVDTKWGAKSSLRRRTVRADGPVARVSFCFLSFFFFSGGAIHRKTLQPGERSNKSSIRVICRRKGTPNTSAESSVMFLSQRGQRRRHIVAESSVPRNC